MIDIALDKARLEKTFKNFDRAMQKAPERILTDNKDGLRKAFSNERKRYIGQDKGGQYKPGVLRKQYEKLIRGKGAGKFQPVNRKWQQRIVKAAISGKFTHWQSIDGLTLRMGTPRRNQELSRRITMLDKSYSGKRGFDSTRYMPIPLWRNIAKSRFAANPPRGKAFRSAVTAGSFTIMKVKGRILYFDTEQKQKNGKFPKRALLYMGVKHTKIEPRTDIVGTWKRDRSKIVKRVATRMRAMSRKVLRGAKG